MAQPELRAWWHVEEACLKVLFLTPYFVPDYAAGSLIYAALAEDLSRMGHEVAVITGMPYYGREQLWDEYKGKFLIEEKSSGYKVIRVYSFVARRTNAPGRLFSWGIYNILSCLVALGRRPPDVLFAMNPFTMAGLPLHVLSRFRGTRVIYSVEDVYPDALTRSGLLKKGWSTALVDALERSCYQRASSIRVLSEGMRETLVCRGVPPGKIAVVPNFADTDFVRPLPNENGFRSKYALEDKFVVLYAGNIGLIHGAEDIVRAACLLKDEPDILFAVVGEGMQKSVLQEMAKDLALSNVRFIPMQPLEDLPKVLASADVSLVTLKREFTSESIPSKVYWILASGRPLIAAVGRNTEIASLIDQAACGLRVDPGSPQALADAVLQLRKDATRRAIMGQRSREFVVRHYSRQAVSEQLNTLIEKVRSDSFCN
jgi:colanic acid biosynthesis glycosyl transferase WcaI